MDKPVFVTKPALPPLSEFIPYLEKIWESHILTNNGPFHKQLESALCEYLGVKHLSLFCNGTIALITALQSLRISGEVITTPYSFVATAHSLKWNGITPVFVDIEDEYFNLDPSKIEAAITPRTTAIYPVHVYGNPCKVDQIEKIAKNYGLRVIYDAAHAFGVTMGGRSILSHGDLSVLSFHSTKAFTTIEGGAIICPDEETKKRIDNLKNFGFVGETQVIAPGINGKMNELQAAFGMMYLDNVDGYIAKRKSIDRYYREALARIPGIRTIPILDSVLANYSYFPVFIDENSFGHSRDDLYDELKAHNVFSRRYFYPLITHFPMYSGYASANKENLPVAEKTAREVLCLPIYPELETSKVDEIVEIICDFSMER